MKWYLTVGEDRFRRNLEKSISPATLFTRFTLPSESGFAGGRWGERGWFFYYRQKGFFSLFSCTLFVRLQGNEGGRGILHLHFSRPRGIRIFWGLWSLLMLFTGFMVVGSSPLFSLWFFLPGGMLLFPLLFFSPRAKRRLLEHLSSAGAECENKKEIG